MKKQRRVPNSSKAETKRAGKQEELIEKWRTGILLEVKTLFIGAGEVKAAMTADTFEATRIGENVQRAFRTGATIELTRGRESCEDVSRSRR